MDTCSSYNFSLGSFLKRQSPTNNKASPLFRNCSSSLPLGLSSKRPQMAASPTHVTLPITYHDFTFFPCYSLKTALPFAKWGGCFIIKHCPWFRNGPKRLCTGCLSSEIYAVFQSLEVGGKERSDSMGYVLLTDWLLQATLLQRVGHGTRHWTTATIRLLCMGRY